MPSCLVTPRWTKTAELRSTFTYMCKNKHSKKSIHEPGTRAGFQLPVSVHSGFSQRGFWSVCLGTVIKPRKGDPFHQC